MTGDAVRPWGDGGYGDSTRYLGRRLPEEPEVGTLVQLTMLHPLYGLDPILRRVDGGWLPHGWIGAPVSWSQIVGWCGGLAPTVLHPQEPAP